MFSSKEIIFRLLKINKVNRKEYHPIQKQFVAFLKENNIYEMYIYNYHNCEFEIKNRPNKFTDFVNQEITYWNGTGIICRAFAWSITEQGTIFWERFHEKWQKKLEKILK